MDNALIKLSTEIGGGITRSTVNTLLQIHRGKDGVIAFSAETQDGFTPLFALTLNEVREQLPALADYLLQDAHFSINTPYAPAPWTNKITGLPHPRRRHRDMRWLNACYIDLDVGRPDSEYSWGDAIGAALNMAESGEILHPSMFARSGQGVYLLWFLVRDHDSDHPPSAFERQISLYMRLNELLQETFKSKFAEAVDGIKDAARVIRVPGTKHSKTGVAANYVIALDSKARPFYYTMEELASFLRVKVIKSELPRDTRRIIYTIDDSDSAQRKLRFTTPDKRGTAPNRRRGLIVRSANIAADILNLCQYHGGWLRGQRYFKLGLYTRHLWYAGEKYERILGAVMAMAGDCQPSYPSDPTDVKIDALVKTIMSSNKSVWGADRLVKTFGVTADIARRLELNTIIPAEVKAEREAEKVSKQDVIKERRERIKNLITRKRAIPTNKQITGLLNWSGFDVSESTVSRDIKAILKELGSA